MIVLALDFLMVYVVLEVSWVVKYSENTGKNQVAKPQKILKSEQVGDRMLNSCSGKGSSFYKQRLLDCS